MRSFGYLRTSFQCQAGYLLPTSTSVSEVHEECAMPHIDAVALHIRDRADEAALARLGAAAVLLWDRIEPETRSHLLSLAPLVAGVTNAGDCGAVLAQLIRNAHDATHVLASAPSEASGAAPRR